MIDWDRLVVESEHNGVIASAGQVALLVGADSDSVSWGNIIGDIHQQPDLMAELDGFVSAESPQFTGVPRTPTPPAGNNSTRIASTAFVQGEIAPKAPISSPAFTGTPTAPTPTAGDSSTKIATTAFVQGEITDNDAPSGGVTYGRKDNDWTALGSLAEQDTVDYVTEVTNKPALGALAAQDYITNDNIQFEQYLFVDAAHGNDDNPGDDVNYPLKTIYKAIQKVTSPAMTTIQIFPGTYTEMPYIRNKNIWLYSLAENENSPVIIETPLYTDNSTVHLYGIMRIAGIQASRRSNIHYIAYDNSYLHTVSRISIGGGSVLNVFPGIWIDDDVELGIAMDVAGGSVITIGDISWGTAPNTHHASVHTVMKADNGIIQYVDFDKYQSLQYSEFKLEINNGKVFQIMNYPEPPDPFSIGTTKCYLRSTYINQFDHIIREWSEAGDMAEEDDAPSDGHMYARKNGDWARNIVDYDDDIIGKPELGEMALVDDAPNNLDLGTRKYYMRTSYRSSQGSLQHNWMQAGGMAQIDDAPSDGHIYGRKNGTWVQID